MMGAFPESHGILGRRDLLVAIASGDQDAIDSICENLRLERRAGKQSTETMAADVSDLLAQSANTSVPQVIEHAYPREIEPISIWLPTFFRQRTFDQKQERVKIEHHWNPGNCEPPPQHQPILSWSQLAPRLRDILYDVRPRKELDLPKILTRLAKRELLERLPVKRGRSWGENGIVVKDINPHLTTFTADQDLVIDSLRDLFSGDQWSEVHGAGPSSLWHRDPATGNPLDPSRRFQAPHQPTSIFVLGDLGCFSPNHRAWIDWLRWGQALRGLGHHLYAMFPGDVQQIPKTLASAFSIQTWQSSRLMIRDPQMRRAVLDQLFVYAAPALLLEPGLLRDLRRLVPGATDASLEIDFWLDERLSNRNASGARIDRG
ncbi:MAG: hypothetical protein AAFP69_20195, partial [Planctomycetota bacterium]